MQKSLSIILIAIALMGCTQAAQADEQLFTNEVTQYFIEPCILELEKNGKINPHFIDYDLLRENWKSKFAIFAAYAAFPDWKKRNTNKEFYKRWKKEGSARRMGAYETAIELLCNNEEFLSDLDITFLMFPGSWQCHFRDTEYNRNRYVKPPWGERGLELAFEGDSGRITPQGKETITTVFGYSTAGEAPGFFWFWDYQKDSNPPYFTNLFTIDTENYGGHVIYTSKEDNHVSATYICEQESQ